MKSKIRFYFTWLFAMLFVTSCSQDSNFFNQEQPNEVTKVTTKSIIDDESVISIADLKEMIDNNCSEEELYFLNQLSPDTKVIVSLKRSGNYPKLKVGEAMALLQTIQNITILQQKGLNIIKSVRSNNNVKSNNTYFVSDDIGFARYGLIIGDKVIPYLDIYCNCSYLYDMDTNYAYVPTYENPVSTYVSLRNYDTNENTILLDWKDRGTYGSLTSDGKQMNLHVSGQVILGKEFGGFNIGFVIIDVSENSFYMIPFH